MILRAFAVGALVALAIAACDTPTEPLDPGDATYAVAYDTAQLVATTPGCDRYFTHAVISLGRRNMSFGFSANFQADCTRSGAGWSYWEVYFDGHYSVRDSLVTFTPAPGPTPPFTGTFDGTFLRVTIPARPDSMGTGPIEATLGPKAPF